ncbi:CRAL/TRIO domain-containing protein, partial [Ramicandelaber brevisporus]
MSSASQHDRFGAFPDPAASGYLGTLTAEQERLLHELRKRQAARIAGEAPQPAAEQFWAGQPVFDTFAARPATYRQAAHTFTLYDHPDAILLRFLRANSWNVDGAGAMADSIFEWRLRTDIAGIVYHGESRVKPELLRKWLGYVQGSDRFGRPVCFFHIRHHSSADQTSDEMQRYVIYQMETVRAFLQPPVETATIVVDMTGFSLGNVDLGFLQTLLRYITSYYPEAVGLIAVYSAPWIFGSVWRVVQAL